MDAPPYQLTKTKHCLGVQCLKALHLLTHQPGLAELPDAGLELVFEQGRKVGEEARRHCPGGVLIEEKDAASALAVTKAALASSAPFLFEAAFLYAGVYVRVDILERVADGSWDLIEVKSSTHRDPHHIPDLAVQTWVAESCRLKIRRAILRHINNQCRFPDLSNLFVDEDSTQLVREALPKTAMKIKEQLACLARPETPSIDIGRHCNEPYACQFKSHCWTKIPQHSIFEMNRLKRDTKFQLYAQGILRIQDIPESIELTPFQRHQKTAVSESRPVLDRDGLAGFLASLEYPIYYLDFETINPAIPRFPGTRPYEQVPFQFSCHEVTAPGEPARGSEYLHLDGSDPRRPLSEALKLAVGERGTVVAYFANFEKAVIDALASTFPDLSETLQGISRRLVDLMDAFLLYYYHPEFHGSTSLKKTLPVLVPSLSYSTLPIQNGALAQAAYYRFLSAETPAEEKDRLREELLEYCGQDTLAMVKIHEALAQLIA